MDNILECPYCGVSFNNDGRPACNHSLAYTFETPFLANYQSEDLLGLVEIQASEQINGEDFRIDRTVVSDVIALCEKYDISTIEEREKILSICPSWFPFRYSEWKQLKLAMGDVDIMNKRVLDVGAGYGFDSWALKKRGAQVVCLEFNPYSIKGGVSSFPELKWYGGVSHALPFKSNSFDAVFFNAALHHMRDIRASLSEAFRVLRPGGYLITTGDSCRSQHQTTDIEYEVFDRHPAVLQGINESIPLISDFIEIIDENREYLSGEIILKLDSAVESYEVFNINEDINSVKDKNAGIALRLKLLKDWPLPRKILDYNGICPTVFLRSASKRQDVMELIADRLPDSLLDNEFPGPPSKFKMLNGWRVSHTTETKRLAYKRSRLFLKKLNRNDLLLTITPNEKREFSVAINGIKVFQEVLEGRKTLPVSLKDIELLKKYVVEVSIDDNLDVDFDSSCFWVELSNVTGNNRVLAKMLQYLDALRVLPLRLRRSFGSG